MKDLILLAAGAGVLVWGLNEYNKSKQKQIVEPDTFGPYQTTQSAEEKAFADSMNDLTIF